MTEAQDVEEVRRMDTSAPYFAELMRTLNECKQNARISDRNIESAVHQLNRLIQVSDGIVAKLDGICRKADEMFAEAEQELQRLMERANKSYDHVLHALAISTITVRTQANRSTAAPSKRSRRKSRTKRG